MYKKITTFIIGFIIILPISFGFAYKSYAATAVDPCTTVNKTLNKTCKECKIDELIKDGGYFSLQISSKGKQGKAQTDFEKALKESKEKNNGKLNNVEIRVAFEKARAEYHKTVKCVFDLSTIAILGSAGGVTDDITLTNLPNLVDLLPSLLKPEMACVDQGAVVTTALQKTSPSELIKPLLESYNKYVEFIKYLSKRSGEVPPPSTNIINPLFELSSNSNALKIVMENEIQDSIVALDTAFIALKELRQAFVLHMHFQCMLKNLEIYRRAMENLRSIVTILPPLFTNASMHK